MKLPNWFKILWWLLLLALALYYLIIRFPYFTLGESIPLDILITLLFFALMLVPIFSEITLFGITLKREIKELKEEVTTKLAEIRTDIKNTQSQTVHTTIHGFGPPPPDTRLPELEREIDRIVKARLQQHQPAFPPPTDFVVPQDHLELFSIRYKIESELRRIWSRRFATEGMNDRSRHQPLIRLLQDLNKAQIIDDNFSGILREVLSICNYAIHGEKVSDHQVDFVKKNAQVIVKYLTELE